MSRINALVLQGLIKPLNALKYNVAGLGDAASLISKDSQLKRFVLSLERNTDEIVKVSGRSRFPICGYGGD